MDVHPGASTFQQPVSVLKFLCDTPNSNISLLLKCELKNKRPTPKLDLKSDTNPHKRYFQQSWYTRFPWLAGCNKENKMYCYRCLLFGSKNTQWCEKGISDLANFIRKGVKHQSSRQHLLNEEKFHLLGKTRVLSKAARLQATKYNEEVSSNRDILGRIIQAMIYLCKNELACGGNQKDENSTNKGCYLSLLDLLAQNESKLRDHLNAKYLSKWTFPDIQNQLIEVITAVVNEKISSEIQQAHFVSVQADETLDVSCKSQMSIIFRYCFKEKIEERFVGFYDVSEQKTAAGLSKIIIDVLKKWDISGDKVVSQTYDGAALMAGFERNFGSDSSQIIEGTENNVQHLVRQEYCPHALLIHCYAHQLYFVILHGSKKIKDVKLFICELTSFHTFFSKSSKRTAMLQEKGFELPNDFHTRAIPTIIKFFTELYQVFNAIIEDVDEQWDSNSISCAIGLKRTMDDPRFVFLLFVFEACLMHVELCFSLLRSISAITTCQDELLRATKAIESLRCDSFVEECFEKSTTLNNTLIFTEREKQGLKILTYEIFFTDEEKQRLKMITYEILDTIVNQMELRFSDLGQLNFLDLINKKFFPRFCDSDILVKEKVTDLIKHYPFFEFEKLQNELHNIYMDKEKHLPPKKLLAYLVSTGLDSVYSEAVKLLQLVLTFPATSTSNERSISTLIRIKKYLQNCMTNSRLSNLSTLAVEKELVSELSYDASFISRVIDLFAEKNNRMDLIYRAV